MQWNVEMMLSCMLQMSVNIRYTCVFHLLTVFMDISLSRRYCHIMVGLLFVEMFM
jgi:hypothetical protein